MACAVLSFLFLSIINFVGQSLPVVLVGTLTQGIPCGMFATIATSYTADICLPTVRDLMASYISNCWVIGQVLVNAVLWATVNVHSEFSFHLPMSFQWLFPIVVGIGCYFAPESPFWLTRQGDFDGAHRSLERLCSPQSPISPSQRLADIQQILKLEEEMHVGGTYLDCFKGSNLRRTEIAIMVSVGQLLSGFAIASQVPYFLQLAGLASTDSFRMAFCKSATARYEVRRLVADQMADRQLAGPPRRGRAVLRSPCCHELPVYIHDGAR